jgi:DNA-binding winged helix-turn-helix (wHTH) protein/tetratricopeptide (TPR) repeat protein
MRPSVRYAFGPFVLDPGAYRLLKHDTPLALSPKALDLLLLFVDRPAMLLTKDDILAALWPDVAVTDNAITKVVSEVRQALGDDSSSPQYVETVARRGYRFVAAIEKLSLDTPSARPEEPPGSRTRTIGVKDFTNVSGDPDVAWLGPGIAETVTNDLRAIAELRVIDRVLVADPAPGGSARLHDVDLVVVGSFQRSGDRLRITARAVDVRTQQALAHAKADGPLVDVFELQDSIVTQLSTGLQLHVSPSAAARIGARETSNLEAYRALSEGRLKLETLDPAAVPAAIEDFERALALDERYALAHVGLAHARFWMFQASRARNRPAVEELKAAITHAQLAIARDPQMAEAHSALALFLASAERSPQAIAAGRLAISLEPGNWRHHFRLGIAAWGGERIACLDAVIASYPPLAYAYFFKANVFVARNALDDARETLERGLAFGDSTASRFPASGLHWLLGLTRLANGDAAGARDEFDREIASASRGLFVQEFAMDAYDGLGFVSLGQKDGATAAAMFERALERYPDHARSLAGLAKALQLTGAKDRASQCLAHARRSIDELRQHQRLAEAAMAAAFCQMVSGDRSGSIETLGQMLAGAPPGAAGWTLPVEPLLATLRTDPAFQIVLARLAERAT